MKEKILCVYVTRQVDSNLMMASTVFRGLYEAGYDTDMVFVGSNDAICEFEERYRKYFRSVYYHQLKTSSFGKIIKQKSPVVYSFFRHFALDAIKLPETGKFEKLKTITYDKILAFVPPYISGAYASKIKKKLGFAAPIIQYWTDPLSLGNCQRVEDIPKSRLMHRLLEKKLIAQADKVVFFYPLLKEMEEKLYPQFANKLSWSYVSYIIRPKIAYKKHTPIKIGLFGAFQSSVRNIKPLIESTQKLNNVKLIIRGDGDIIFDEKKYPNVDIRNGRLPISEIENYEANCDILVSLNGFRNIGPAGKTFYYASYNKPIICIGDGMHADYFINYMDNLDSRYIVCRNNMNEICGAIIRAIDQLDNFELNIPEKMNAAIIAKNILDI